MPDVLLMTVAALLLLALPMAGAVAAGQPVTRYLEFPPLTRYVEHAPFSGIAFVFLAALIVLTVGPFAVRILSSRPAPGVDAPPRGRLPWWTWLGVAGCAGSWFLAWNRFEWFAPFQVFVFTPLWLSYIVVVNGLTVRRTGSCPMTGDPRLFAALFPASALFWWFFEYLNRFVQNWHYSGPEDLTRGEYVLFATLPFSTVLPAVASTCALLGSFPRLTAGLDSYIAVRVRRPRTAAWATLTGASVSLALVGALPDLLFPLVWVSPLLVVASLQALAGRTTVLTPLAAGDWRRAFLLAGSALACGFFWEMWNSHSLVKWSYAVPYVGGMKVFEMPLLGYAGYLPFGLECGMAIDLAHAAVSRAMHARKKQHTLASLPRSR